MVGHRTFLLNVQACDTHKMYKKWVVQYDHSAV